MSYYDENTVPEWLQEAQNMIKLTEREKTMLVDCNNDVLKNAVFYEDEDEIMSRIEARYEDVEDDDDFDDEDEDYDFEDDFEDDEDDMEDDEDDFEEDEDEDYDFEDDFEDDEDDMEDDEDDMEDDEDY